MKKLSSPLRYPGGKQKLLPLIEKEFPDNYDVLLECFAGGASISLGLLFKNKIKEVILNDSDELVYSFWKCVFTSENNLLLRQRLFDTDVTLDLWKKLKNDKSTNIVDMAFKCLFFNRTNFSGILKAGPIGGKNQTGNYKIDCRWNKERLIKLISKIGQYSDRVIVENLDFSDFISKYNTNDSLKKLWYFDPPYYYKANQLYNYYFKPEDHIVFRDCLLNIHDDYVISYDDCSEIRNIFNEKHIIKNIDWTSSASIENNYRKKNNELFIIKAF